MFKKRVFGIMAVLAALALVFALVGCGGGDGGPAGGGGTGGGGGGDQPGANIAAKYRFTSNEHSSEWIGPTPDDEADITVTVGETTITWTGGTNGSFTNVSTGDDKNLSGGTMIGTWAYLYSGNNKIGIAIAYSDLAGGIKMVFTGKRHVQAFMMTVGATLLDVSALKISAESVYSDIAESVINISGEYNPIP